MLYLYDNTFEGLLCAFAEALAAGEVAAEFGPAGDAQPSLFAAPFRVGSDAPRAEALLARVRAQVSTDAVRRLTYLWLSERPGLEAAAYQYIRLGFEHGAAVDRYHTHPAVRETARVSRLVGGEVHRLHGLLRFRQLSDGSFAAPMAPDHNVLLPVAWHFQRRLGNERWMIHDTRRQLGAFHDGRQLELLELESSAGAAAESPAVDPVRYSAAERTVQQLWRQYFRAIAIPERRNALQQRRCMPRRYWRYLIEVPGASSLPPAAN